MAQPKHRNQDTSFARRLIGDRFFCCMFGRDRHDEAARQDRKILRALLENGRLSNTELSEKVGLSPSPCWQRVKRLEEEGVIRGYTAILDQAQLGFTETVIIEVMLERHDDEVLERFGEAMAALPEVLEAYLTTGEYDYLIKVAVAGTAGCEQFLRRKLYKIEGVRHSRSCFALKCLKHTLSVVPDTEPPSSPN